MASASALDGSSDSSGHEFMHASYMQVSEIYIPDFISNLFTLPQIKFESHLR